MRRNLCVSAWLLCAFSFCFTSSVSVCVGVVCFFVCITPTTDAFHLPQLMPYLSPPTTDYSFCFFNSVFVWSVSKPWQVLNDTLVSSNLALGQLRCLHMKWKWLSVSDDFWAETLFFFHFFGTLNFWVDSRKQLQSFFLASFQVRFFQKWVNFGLKIIDFDTKKKNFFF